MSTSVAIGLIDWSFLSSFGIPGVLLGERFSLKSTCTYFVRHRNGKLLSKRDGFCLNLFRLFFFFLFPFPSPSFKYVGSMRGVGGPFLPACYSNVSFLSYIIVKTLILLLLSCIVSLSWLASPCLLRITTVCTCVEVRYVSS